MKEETTVTVQGNGVPVEHEEGFDEVIVEKKGTMDDQKEMYRMGKPQEMRRNFRLVSIFGFSMILMASWETALSVSTIGLINGGTAGLIWMFLFAWIGFICVNVSMAEMGSMAPTAGGQYHWVSEFASPKHQKFLSYIIGWFCVLGWQTGAANTAFIAGTEIQGLVILNHPDYVPQRWHGTLLVFAVSAFSVFFNTVLAKRLPLIEGIVLIVHIFGFFAILVPLWVLGPRGDAHQVFTQFNDYGGWGNLGGSALVGILAAMIPLLGADAAVHMAEELRDASKQLPRSMIWTTVINGALGWIMVITFCFCLGDLDAAIGSPYAGYAFIQVFYNATGSRAGTTAMASLVIFMQMFCNLSIVATASRQLFAFARDQGVPFTGWLAYVHPTLNVPVNAILVSFLISCLMSLINIGSTVAFNSIASLSLCAILASYIVSISCILLKRLRHEPLLPARFTLGKLGIPLNIASLIFLVFVFVLSFFPGSPMPTPEWMNWSSLMFGAVCIFSLVYYWFKGRFAYAGPVEYVRKGI